jgi:hypothetical protein
MTHALARSSDPTTSHQAAFEFDAKVTAIERRILDELKGLGRGGMTTHALAAVLGLELVTVSPRMKPLLNKGLVRDSGRRSESPSGRKRIIWERT